jgi:uncharacterized protein YbaR (Trm112 family)
MTDRQPLIPPDLLAIMQCPKCSGTLKERLEPPALLCSDCGTAYAVRDGIPNMIVEEADTGSA